MRSRLAFPVVTAFLSSLLLLGLLTPANAALVHQWNLDDGAGSLVSPQTGLISGAIHGGTSWVASGPPTTELPGGGQVTTSNSLLFGGTEADFVDFTADNSLSPDYLSVAFWAKGLTDESVVYSDKVILSKHGNVESASSWEFGFATEPYAQKLSFKVWTDQGSKSAGNASFTGTDFKDGAWHHFVGTYDGSQVSLYADGALIDRQAHSGAVVKTSDPLFLGQRPYLGDSRRDGWAFPGYVGGPLLIYDNALSEQQVADMVGYVIEPPPEPELVAQWNLDETVGGTTTPKVVGPQDGVITGTMTLGAGGPPATTLPDETVVEPTHHFTCGGTASDFINLGNDEALSPGQITVAIWAKATELHTGQILLSKHGNSGSSYEMGVGNSGSMWFRTFVGSEYVFAGASADDPFTNEEFNDGDWHLFVGTHSETESAFYVDGELIQSVEQAGLLYSTAGVTDLQVGARPYVGAEAPFSGKVGGPVLIYNYAMTAEEIAALLDTSLLPGDLNGDGFVGGDDLDIVRSFWGQTVPAGDLESGDPSNDGFVGGDDLDIVRANWGQGTPPAPTCIPEPGWLVLSVSSLLALAAWRRRH